MDKEYYQLNLQHAIGAWETSYPLKLKIGDSQYMDLNIESIPLVINVLEAVFDIEKIKLEGKTSYPLKLKIGDSQYMDLNIESIPLVINVLETVLHIEKIKLEGKK